jgi:integrase
VGRKSDALALYQKRKNEIRVGTKLPENMRRTSIRFGQLAEDIRRYSEKHHRDHGHIESRLKRILPDFETRQADQIKPEEIDGWIARNTKAAATANRYRALFSLIFREALRNGKVTGNPARLVRLRHENNGRIRFLTDDEEKRLRKANTKQFPEHLPELTVSLGTGMRLSEQYSLAWEQIDFARKEINLEHTKNGSARTIPMNSDVLKAFEILHEMDKPALPNSRVFPLPQSEVLVRNGARRCENCPLSLARQPAHVLFSARHARRKHEGDPATRRTQDNPDERALCTSW